MKRRVVGGRRAIGTVLTYAALIAVCCVVLMPIVWMVVASLQGPGIPSGGLLPERFTLSAYVRILETMPFLTWYRNSLIAAVATMVIVVAMSVGSSYALARLRFRGKKYYAVSIVAMQLLPGVIIAIPMYVLLAQLNLINTRQGLVLTFVSHSLPFAVWLLWSFMLGIPRELEEAAQIDGANRWQIIGRIVLPLSTPGLVTIGLFTFVRSYEEYLYPLLITPQTEIATLTVGAARLIGPQSIDWGGLMAYSTMMIVPMFLIFVFAQRFLLAGMTAGAVKS